MPLRLISGLVFLLAAFFGPFSAVPARAGILQCLNALIPVGSAIKLAGETADPEFLQCSAHLSTGDPVFVSTVGLIVGAGAAGAYDSQATCEQMTTGQIGKLVADVLTHMGALSSALKSLLGEDGYQALVAFASSEGASNIATETPLKSIFEYMSCGCTIYGKAKAVAQVATDYIGDVKECAAFVTDVGGAVLDLAESGADSIGELFGHHDDGPTAVMDDNYPQCGDWQFMRDTAALSASGGRIVETITPRPYYTVRRTCSCAAPSRLETKPASDGMIAVRCACDTPVNGTYDSKSETCGCRPSEKLENGACVACDSEVFSQTTDTNTVVSGTMTLGVCKPVTKTCPAGQMPVRAKAGYYYECQPVCAADEFFVKRPGDLARDGICTSCPRNAVPNADSLAQGRLVCEECPAGSVARPGDRQCRSLDCANGIDPANPHACKAACRLLGEGKAKRLVCDGGITVDQPKLLTCPPKTTRVGVNCVPDVYHKPKELIIQRERETPRAKDLKRKPVQTAPPVARNRDAGQGDEFLGRVEPQNPGPSVGDLLNFGLGVGKALDLGSGRTQRGEPAFDASPRNTETPSRIPRTTGPAVEAPVERNTKD